MYYSILNIPNSEDHVPYVCNCGFNSKSKEEIKENILKYIGPHIESLTDYKTLKESSIESILSLFYLEIYEHEYPLDKFTYASDTQEKKKYHTLLNTIFLNGEKK